VHARARAGVGLPFEGDTPEVVHRLWEARKTPFAPRARGGGAERERAAVQAVAELRSDHRELAEPGVDNPLLEARVTLEDEAEHRWEYKQ
jgi:hypothetical protein